MGHVLSAPIRSQNLQRKGSEHFWVGSTEMQGFRMDMEDTHTINLSMPNHPNYAYFGCYDGHAGNKCSIFLEAELWKRVNALSKIDDPELLSRCVQAFDAEFLENEEDRQNGSTCCFCVIKHPEKGASQKVWEVTVANVGDSRAMIIRKDGTLISLTTDHKPESFHEEERIKAAGGTVQMNRVDGQLAMSRAIGDWNYKANPNLAMDEQKVTAVPDITTEICYEGDRLLLCCDGIVEQMTNEDAASFVHEHFEQLKDDPARVCYKLLEYSLERGSKDNHSAMLMVFGDGTEYDQKEDEFVAGPFGPWKDDAGFVRAYKEDAKKYGYEGEELMAMAKKTELSMPHLKEEKRGMAGMGGGAGGGGPPPGLTGLLEAMMMSGNPNSKEMLNMLMPQVLGSLPDEEDNEEGEQGNSGSTAMDE